METKKETFMNTIYPDNLHYIVESFEADGKVQHGRWSMYSFGLPIGMADFSIFKNGAGNISFEIGKYIKEDYYHKFVINKENLFYPAYELLLGNNNQIFIWKDPEIREKFLRIKRENQEFVVDFKGFNEDEEHRVELKTDETSSLWDKRNMEKINIFLLQLNERVEVYHNSIKPQQRKRRIINPR